MLNMNKLFGNKKKSIFNNPFNKQNKNLNINFDNNSKDKINYRNESFPGFNIPKPYKGEQQYKKRVLANDGNDIKVINFGHKDYSDYTIHKDYDRMKNFRARHKCDKDKPNKLSARYWACENLWPNVKPDQLSKNKFKPFRYNQDAEELTAAKRFGGKNLENLKQIGQGRDRKVYALDEDKILKIAKNPGGLTQNTTESNLDYPTGQIKHYETGKDYVVMERADKPGKATKEMLQHLKKAKDESYNRNEHQQRADFFNSPHFEASGLDASDFSSYSVTPQEFVAKRQWGEKDGKPVLIDGGALSSGDDLSRHRVKDFNPDNWQYKEWQEVQAQRQQNKNKGRIKPDYPEYQERSDVLADLFSENKYVPTPGIMEKFSQNPTRKVCGTDKGECDEAASWIVTDALKQGVPFNQIQVLSVRAPNPNKGEKIHSSHVVTNVEGSIFDPTKTQFKYDNPGPLISDELDDKYHSPKVLPTEPYIKSSLGYVKEDKNSKNMAYFSINQENEIYGLDWNKDQKGKKLGEGNHGEVFEVKDNPKYILKVPKNKFGSYYGSTKEEMNKYNQFADNELIAPSIETKQGIVREKLNIVSRGATKQDWDNNKKKNDPRVIGYSFFEKNNINKNQAKQIVAGVNDLSQKGIRMEDEMQIGISPTDKKPYLYDIGTFSQQKDYYDKNYARDDNDRYKERFLEGVGHSKLFDRDYDKEADDALKEIENDTTSENKYIPKIEQISPYKIKNTYEKYEYGPSAQQTVSGMVKHLKQGGKLPPILVSEDGELIDGRHRQEAYKDAGIEKVPIIKGESPHASSIYDLQGNKLNIKRGIFEGQSYAYVDSDEDIKQDTTTKNKLMFWKKDKPQPEYYEETPEYPEVTNQEFARQQQYEESIRSLPNYGEVQNISGNKIGNAMIAADVIIPSGKLLTLGGFGVKKYVDKVKLIKTDEHDNRYTVPRVEFHTK